MEPDPTTRTQPSVGPQVAQPTPQAGQSFQEFVGNLMQELAFDLPEPVHEDVRLFDDLQFDSLQVFLMILHIELAAGLDDPVEDPPEMFTLGEAFQYYVVCCATAA